MSTMRSNILEAQRLATVRSLGLLDTGPEQEFDELAELAAAICGVPTSLVTLLDERRQFHKSKIGVIDLTEIPRSVAFCEYTIQQDGVFVVEDAAADPMFASNPLVTKAPEIRFYAGAPLVMSDGSKVGALCVLDIAARGLTAQQTHALATLARQVVARMELRQKRLLLDETLAKLKTSEDLFRTFANHLPFETYLKDASGRIVFYNAKIAERYQITSEEWLGKCNRDLWPPELAAQLDERDRNTLSSMSHNVSTSETPNADGSTTHWRAFQVPYRNESGDLLLAGMAFDISEQVEREARMLRYQNELERAVTVLHAHALTDELTGLWNREAFHLRLEAELASARRTNSALGVVLLDVNDLPGLTDRLGAAGAAAILCQVAYLLKAHIRQEDNAGRFGEERFAIVVARADQSALEVLAARLLAEVKETAWAREPVTLRLGLATLRPDDEGGEALIARATAALLEAESAGKTCWKMHSKND